MLATSSDNVFLLWLVWRSNGLCRAGGAGAPVDDFGFVEGESVVVGGVQAGHLAHSAVDVDETFARPADEVVVVVADAVLVAGGGPRGLDAPDDPLVDQDAERVVLRVLDERIDAIAAKTKSGTKQTQKDAELERLHKEIRSDIQAALDERWHDREGNDD